MKITFIKTVLLALIATPFVISASDRVNNQPNIIFFIADDISQDDFGCYGHPVIKTPNIDQIASKGIRFDNAYLTTSSCSPSRCSIVTGRYPHNTGAPELHIKLPNNQIRFPELLKNAGYYTVLSGKNHMLKMQDRAFNQITRGGGPGGQKDWVSHVRNRPKDKPFFFWFASTDAHRSWQESKEAPLYSAKDVVIPPYLVDTQVTREDLASYYHEVSRFDHFIGEVKAELIQQGVLNNTMIVIAADNGRPFPRCKSRLYDSGIKTPWIVQYPDLIKTPATTQSFISAIDLSATCLEIANIQIPECIQGQSFVSILKDPTKIIREMVFAEHNWHVYKNHERMIRFGDYLYIKNNYPNQPNLCYESDTHYPAGEELWKAHAAGLTTASQQQIFSNPCPSEELFKISSDPHQLINLANNSEYKEIIEKARTQLALWTKETGDTIPVSPTQNRHEPPRIVDGEIIESKKKSKNSYSELPGQSANASKINHPGPINF